MVHNIFKTILEYFSVLLIVALIIIVIMGVGARTIDISLPWYDELASVFLVWLTYIGGAYVMLISGHMSFDGLILKLSGNLQRTAFAICEIIIIGFFVIIAYYGYLVLEVFADETMVSLSWVKLSFTQSVIPISAVLFILARLFAMPEMWKKLQQGTGAESEYISDIISATKEK